eukprot:85121-Hanusia_phi.AAC.6
MPMEKDDEVEEVAKESGNVRVHSCLKTRSDMENAESSALLESKLADVELEKQRQKEEYEVFISIVCVAILELRSSVQTPRVNDTAGFVCSHRRLWLSGCNFPSPHSPHAGPKTPLELARGGSVDGR